jgi:hypothetical protein
MAMRAASAGFWPIAVRSGLEPDASPVAGGARPASKRKNGYFGAKSAQNGRCFV